MRTRDFYYSLPAELIAQHALPDRIASRLLFLDGTSGVVEHRRFVDLMSLLKAGDLLVFNDTRVMPARLYGVKHTGGKVEVLIERVLDKHRVLAQVRASKPPKPQGLLLLEEVLEVRVVGRKEEFYELLFLEERPVVELLQIYGHVPLPPYIDRPDDSADHDRYQTVYAEHLGAVAAPTAGLHFDKTLLANLNNSGVDSVFMTLHVGAGTFTPVRVDDIRQHRMHPEYVNVTQEVCDAVVRCRKRGGRVVAVGTTAVRGLETASRSGEISPYCGDTDLFIVPGFVFQTVDVLITNFHLPESTLLMLVCAFGGYTQVMHAYQTAVEQRYRFYSYGDAMLVTKRYG